MAVPASRFRPNRPAREVAVPAPSAQDEQVALPWAEEGIVAPPPLPVPRGAAVEFEVRVSPGGTVIIVPAGTYRAAVVSETTTMSFFGIGRPVTFSDKTWLAPGVGPVQEQQALINTAGSYHVTATMALESFSKS